MSKLKKSLAMIVAVLMVLTSMPATAFAEGTQENATRSVVDPNPSYTVQYWAYMDHYATSGSGTELQLIDTSGKKLPKNDNQTNAPALKTLYLNSDGSVKMKNVLTEIYSSRQTTFKDSPDLRYVNKVASNYILKEVWVLKDGKNANSTNEDDWTVYEYPEYSNFTNNEKYNNTPGVIYIPNNAVIRMVYDPSTAGYDEDANFFDYDITDGYAYRKSSGTFTKNDFTSSNRTDSRDGSKKIFVKTYGEGINSGNYNYAFGNNNTAMGKGLLLWNNNYLNTYNSDKKDKGGSNVTGTERGYAGCTFGLVSGLENGLPVFSNGVTAPDIFSNKAVKGKKIVNDYSLSFNQVGDKFTLNAVKNEKNKIVTKNLAKFKNPHTTYTWIWTNNFWPMDSISTWGAVGHDIKMGHVDKKENLNVVHFTETEGRNINDNSQLPSSDDKYSDHNFFFGMSYTVDFELTEDYVGPLDYTFFGDDDMWVFLTDKETGNSQLVCDIGGVHSSVGSYVNLRDYLPNGSSGKYKLNIFYTERGASGSTCYMQFTLPSVNTIETTETEDLRIDKEVYNDYTEGEDFEFNVNLTLLDSQGRIVKNNYHYTKYEESVNAAGETVSTPVETGVIFGEYGNPDDPTESVMLKNNQHVVIEDVPIGTTYKISEITYVKNSDGTVTNNVKDRYDTKAETSEGVESDESVNLSNEGGKQIQGVQVNGTVTEDSEDKVVFGNTLKTGTIKVNKKVDGHENIDKTKEFSFKIKLTNAELKDKKLAEFTFDENGVAEYEFTLKHGNSKEFKYIPIGTAYEITETADGNYTSAATGASGTVSEKDKTYTADFTNTVKLGGLEISKTVDKLGQEAEPGKEFEFTVTLDNSSVNGQYGKVGDDTNIEFKDGVATFKLAHGEKAVITGLPAGMGYTVAETADSKYSTSFTVDGEEVNKAAGVIVPGSNQELTAIAYTNTIKTADLSLTKKIDGNGADGTEKFEFTVTLDNKNINGKFGDMTFENGVASVVLKGGETATATGLPMGTGYEITEAADSDYVVSSENAKGSLEKVNETYAAVFTNTVKTGDLSIKKIVAGNNDGTFINKGETFTFNVKLENKNIADDSKYGSFTFKDGEAVGTITLKHDEQAVIEGLPVGTVYTITETGNDKYHTSVDGDETDTITGTITAIENAAADANDHSVVYTNTMKYGKLSVTKILKGDGADRNQEFEFTVDLKNADINGTFGDMTFENGTATVNLKGGQTATATGLPVGTAYTVTESAYNDYESEANNKAAGTIDAEGETYAAAYTNTIKTGSLELIKDVTGNGYINTAEKFSFNITLTNENIEDGTEIGDFEFENGEATAVVDLADEESFKISGLPVGTKYVIEEEANDRYDVTINDKATGTAEGTIEVDGENNEYVVTVVNSMKYGDLELSKIVDENGQAVQPDKEYSFEITLKDPAGTGYDNVTFGNIEFKNGKAEVALAHGEKVVLTGIPVGSEYKITEEAYGEFATTSEGAKGTISEEGAAYAAEFTNTLMTGDLSLVKTVKGEDKDSFIHEDEEFKFTVQLKNKDIADGNEYSGFKFDGGEAEGVITLKHGEQAVIEGLPVGTEYVIEEEANDRYDTFAEGEKTNKITGTITAVEGAAVNENDHSVEYTNVMKYGELSVTKTLEGDGADKNKEFKFTVELDNANINGVFGDMTFEKGVATVSLKGGQTATAAGLPVGTDYKVIEEVYRNYDSEAAAEEGTISEEGKTYEVEYTNTIKTGELKLTKDVTGNGYINTEEEFSFTIDLTNANIADETKIGDFEFKDGAASVKVDLADGEEFQIEGLPVGTEYVITEAANDRYDVTINGQTTDSASGIIAVDGRDNSYVVEVENGMKYGDLELSKIVDENGQAVQPDKEYSFEITLEDPAGEGYDGVTFGDVEFKNGKAEVALAHGETVKLTGIPVGSEYEITEEQYEEFATSSEGAKGTISEEGAVYAAEFVNTLMTGDLSLTKTVAGSQFGSYIHEDEDFTFIIQLKNENIADGNEYGTFEFIDGEANGTLTLKHDEEVTIEGLPVGTEYAIEEKINKRYDVFADGENRNSVTGIITAGKKYAVNENDHSVEYTNVMKYGKLSVTKTLEGDGADKNKEFKFTVELGNKNISGTYGDMTFEEGVAELSLKGGQTATAAGLPLGTDYKVTEAAYGDYDSEAEAAEGTISEEDTTYAAGYTNTIKTGKLTFQKLVSSESEDGEYINAQEEFEFDIVLENANIEDDTLFKYEAGTEKGTVTFEDGIAKIEDFNLVNGEAFVLEGIPVGTDYEIVENTSGLDDRYDVMMDGKDSNSTTGTISTNSNANSHSVVCDNGMKYGELTISKAVDEIGNIADPDKAFTFKIILKDAEGKALSGNFSDVVFNEKGEGEIKLKNGESKTISGLPVGAAYTVSEAADDRYNTEVAVDGNDPAAGASANGAIDEEGASVAFTNTVKTGQLTVSKNVHGKDAEMQKEFHFTIVLNDEDISGEFGDVVFDGGRGEFDLADDESIEIINLPVGTEYTITEKSYDRYDTAVSVNEGEATAGTVAEGVVSEENGEYTVEYDNTIKTAEIAIYKYVIGKYADRANEVFTFDLSLTNPENSEAEREGLAEAYDYAKYYDADVEDNDPGELVEEGEISDGDTFTLKDSEYILIKGLPVGTVAEASENADDRFITKAAVKADLESLKAEEESGIIKSAVLEDSDGKKNDLDDIVFTNTVKTGEIVLFKYYEGDEANIDDEFSFEINIDQINGNGDAVDNEYSYIRYAADGTEVESGTVDGNESIVVIKGGEYIVIDEIPTGTEYTITEVYDDRYDTEITVNGDMYPVEEDLEEADIEAGNDAGIEAETDPLTVEGTVDGNGDVYEIKYTNILKTGDLTVAKTVKGKDADPDKQFKFRVTLDNTKVNGFYSEEVAVDDPENTQEEKLPVIRGMEFKDGVAEFTLKAGESLTAAGLPAGVKYTVEEIDPNGYTLIKYEGNTGEISSDAAGYASFVNEAPDKETQTGDDTNLFMWFAMMLMSLMIAAVIYATGRRARR